MILNEDGDALTSVAMYCPADDAKAFQIRIECRAGFILTAGVVDADVSIWGKADSGDTFQDLASDPIDLTPYDGETRFFYFEARVAVGQPAGTVITPIIVEAGAV